MRPALAAPLVASLVALTVAACGARRIPGTEIQDTPETRAIVATIDAYRKAAERRDADGVLGLVSRTYFDDAGTPDPSDDVDYDQLRARLARDYSMITMLRLDIGVRSVEIQDGRASAYVFYDERYRIQTRTGELPKQASDVHRMTFVREGTVWKFASGL